jgi:hypothetical protein
MSGLVMGYNFTSINVVIICIIRLYTRIILKINYYDVGTLLTRKPIKKRFFRDAHRQHYSNNKGLTQQYPIEKPYY